MKNTRSRRSGSARLNIYLGLVLAVAVLLAVGCGDGDNGGGGGSASTDEIRDFKPPSGVSEGVEANTFPVKKVDGGCRIAVLFPYNIEFFQNVAYGTTKEAERLGCDVSIQAAKGYGDTTNQLQQFDTALAKDPDAIIIGVADQEALAPAVNRAWERGIPVVYSEIKAPSDKVLAIFTDDEAVGRLQGEYIAKKDPEAKIIAMCGPPGIAWAKIRCQGLTDALKEKAPKAEVVAQKFHAMERGEVTTVAGNTMEAFPDANWIYNSTDLQATGVVDALRNKGDAAGDMGVTTLTIGRETGKLLEEGWIEMALAERPVLVGQLGVAMAVKVLNGEQLDSGVWEPGLPEVTPQNYESTFCGGDCSQINKGEISLNWAPKDFSF